MSKPFEVKMAAPDQPMNVSLPTLGTLSPGSADISGAIKHLVERCVEEGQYVDQAAMDAVLEGLASTEYVDDAIAAIPGGGEPVDLSNYYTKDEVDDAIAAIPGGGSVDLSDYYTKSEVDEAIASIPGGDSPSGSDVFIAEYGTTTNAEIEAAYQSGMAVFCRAGQQILVLYRRQSSVSHWFYNVKVGTALCVADAWSTNAESYTPGAHASTHAADGSDPITPESIGAKAANDSDVFIAEYDVTTSEEIEAAYQAGKAVFVKDDGLVAPLLSRSAADVHIFGASDAVNGMMVRMCFSDSWMSQTQYYTPATHAASHAADGADAITPESIGAASKEYVDAVMGSYIDAVDTLLGGDA